jgi:hypothetical protein
MSSTIGVNSGSRPKKLHSFSAPGLSRVGLLVPGISPKSWSLTMMRRVNSTMAASRQGDLHAHRRQEHAVLGRNLDWSAEASTISVLGPWCAILSLVLVIGVKS